MNEQALPEESLFLQALEIDSCDELADFLDRACGSDADLRCSVEALLRQLDGPVIVVWDGGGMHHGDPIGELVDRFPDRLCLEKYPPYAPMLNPPEYLWSWLKYSRLNNFAPRDAFELDDRVVHELAAVHSDQGLLESFIHAAGLPIRLTLLT